MKVNKMRAWIVWFLIVTFTIWLHVIQTGYAVFNGPLQKSLNLSIEQIGVAAAIYPCTAAVLQLFTGALLDELGPRKTIIPAILVAICGVLLFSNATTYPQILLSQFVFACATSFAFVGCGYLIGKWFPSHEFGQVFGFAQVLLSIAAAFGQIGFDYLLRIMNWRHILNSFSIVGIVLFALAYKYIKLPNAKIKESKFDYKILTKVTKSSMHVIQNKTVMFCSIYGGIVYGYIWAFGTLWLPKILIKKGMALQAANQGVSCLWLGLALGSLFIDKIWKYIGSTKNTLRIMIAAQAALLYIIAFVELNSTTVMILSFAYGMSTSSHMLTYTIAKESVKEEYSGATISIVNASMFMIGGLFVALIGYIIGMSQETLHDYQNVIVLFSLAIVIAFMVTNYMEDEMSLEEAVYEQL